MQNFLSNPFSMAICESTSLFLFAELLLRQTDLQKGSYFYMPAFWNEVVSVLKNINRILNYSIVVNCPSVLDCLLAAYVMLRIEF